MNVIYDALNHVFKYVGRDFDSVGGIFGLLGVILILSVYEFMVYRVVTKKTLYNKSFHTSIMVLPFFIGSIVASLQSNLVITLGTIGALAIIRFRTVIKDPIDMIYILWSIYIGISCGCHLYESALITSLVVTIVLIGINLLSGKLLKNPYILVLNCSENKEEELNTLIKNFSKTFRLKSRNFTSGGVDFVYQLELKNPSDLTKSIQELSYVKRFSLLEFDNDDIM